MANGRTMANPAPLGLAAFGITLFLASSSDANLWNRAGGAPVLSMALIFGGIVCILVSILEFVRGDAIGLVFFGTFGAFWLTIWYYSSSQAQPIGIGGPFFMSFAVAAFIFWMAVMGRSMLHNLFGFFVTLTLGVQAYGNWGSGNLNAIKIAGWIGILTALIALYMAAKALINDENERVILP